MIHINMGKASSANSDIDIDLTKEFLTQLLGSSAICMT